jgi:hypothetical protein
MPGSLSTLGVFFGLFNAWFVCYSVASRQGGSILLFHRIRQSNLQEFTSAMQATPGIEVRLRKWY